jgi:putative ABC transport system permease protein
MGLSETQMSVFLKELSDEDIKSYATMVLMASVQEQYALEVQQEYKEQLISNPQELSDSFDALILGSDETQLAKYYDSITEFSTTTYEDNLEKFGYIDLSNPSSINIYASSFENKDVIELEIKEYNKTRDKTDQIKYNDYVGDLMSSVTTIIDAITYVLIAFVAISLIVSSIMIAVITLISVQERTKEIGVLRAIGASKKDVSSMFNAETVIIGLASGLTGILVTYLLCIPINIILFALTGIANLKAVLPFTAAVILVLISVVLNLISGIIPSRSAAKKDPVVALRTE